MSTGRNDTQLVTVVLLALGALVVLPAVFMGIGMMGFGPAMGGMWHGTGDGTAPGWMLLAGVLMQLFFLVAIVGAGYLLYRAVVRTDGNADPALEELRMAYARGELDDEEYERRREALERDS